MERSSLLVGVTVDLGAVLDQLAGRLKVAYVGGVMQRGPAIRVDIVDISVAVFKNGLESVTLALLVRAEHSLVDGSFTENAGSLIDFITTIDQVPQVLGICLCSRHIQILHHVSGELILADLQWILSKGSRSGLSAESDQVPRDG